MIAGEAAQNDCRLHSVTCEVLSEQSLCLILPSSAIILAFHEPNVSLAGGGHSDEITVKEMQKWRIVTYAAVPLCIGMGVYALSGTARAIYQSDGITSLHRQECYLYFRQNHCAAI